MWPGQVEKITISTTLQSPIVYITGADEKNGYESTNNNQLFQEKADEAGVIIVVVSKSFSRSKTCQQQVSTGQLICYIIIIILTIVVVVDIIIIMESWSGHILSKRLTHKRQEKNASENVVC